MYEYMAGDSVWANKNIFCEFKFIGNNVQQNENQKQQLLILSVGINIVTSDVR